MRDFPLFVFFFFPPVFPCLIHFKTSSLLALFLSLFKPSMIPYFFLFLPPFIRKVFILSLCFLLRKSDSLITLLGFHNSMAFIFFNESDFSCCRGSLLAVPRLLIIIIFFFTFIFLPPPSLYLSMLSMNCMSVLRLNARWGEKAEWSLRGFFFRSS